MDAGVALGMDGGASSVKWSVRGADGRLDHGRTEGANLQLIGWERFLTCLTQAIREALSAAGASQAQVRSIGLGLSGVDRPEEKQRLLEWLPSLLPNLAGCWVGNDALPALRQGAGRLTGIVLIAGSGSICVGVARNGQTVRTGGWGAALGDEGSGFWIGRGALAAACPMADGRRKETPLLAEILGALEINDPISIIPWVAAQAPDEFIRRLAALAPRVFGLARRGDRPARRIVRLAAAHLAAHVLTTARKLDILEGEAEIERTRAAEATLTIYEPRAVVCAGGLFAQNPEFFELLKSALSRRNGRLKATRLTEPASLGSLALGAESDTTAPKSPTK